MNTDDYIWDLTEDVCLGRNRNKIKVNTEFHIFEEKKIFIHMGIIIGIIAAIIDHLS